MSATACPWYCDLRLSHPNLIGKLVGGNRMEDSCRDILVVQNLSILKEESRASLYVRSIIDRDNYESAKHTAGASYADVFGANYDDFSSKREQDRRYFEESYSTSESLSALTLFTPDSVIKAWADCMRANARGLFCWLEGNAADRAFILIAEWSPDVGIAGSSLRDVECSVYPDTGTANLVDSFPKTSQSRAIQHRHSSRRHAGGSARENHREGWRRGV